MYKIATFSKSIVSGVVLSLALFSANSFAGPGKPGKGNQPEALDDRNIVEIALGANALLNEFNYLLGAVGCFTDETGYNPIVELLTGEDKLTLFAPTDAAFKALQGVLGVPEEARAPEVTCQVDEVLQVEGALFTILAYHLTDGRRFSNSVFNKNNSKEIEMLAGGYITTTNSLTIIDGFPQVISPVPTLIDINATNGVVHVIDTVMLPFNPFAGEE